jgi:hypothetical protein
MNRTWRAQDFAAYFGEVEYEGMRDYGELSISGDAQDEIETSSGEQDEESAVEHGEESGGAAVGKVDSLYEELRVSEQDRRKRTFMEMVRNAAALSRAE